MGRKVKVKSVNKREARHRAMRALKANNIPITIFKVKVLMPLYARKKDHLAEAKIKEWLDNLQE